MSQLNPHALPSDRAEIIELLKRAAKKLKKSGSDQKLAVFQDEIARSLSYQNWSILRKNAARMTQLQFAVFAAQVVQKVNVHEALLAQPKLVEAGTIKCTLFSPNIGYLGYGFKDREPQAIVLSDVNKIQAAMESNDAYYYNAGKVHRHKIQLKKGSFEVPLVAPRGIGDYLIWIEGFHQVNAAIENGLTIVPIGTSLALAQILKSLVGVSSPDTVAHPYDFSKCEATVV